MSPRDLKDALLAADDHDEAPAPSIFFSPVFTQWWVLFVYTLVAALQGATWTLPGLLAGTEQAVYGISPDTTQLLLNYGPIFYLVAAAPSNYVIDRFGVRASTLIGALLMLASNGLRLFASDTSAPSIACLHLSFILCAIAGPIAMAVPVKLAEDFFAPAQRTLATAVAALGNQSGGFVRATRGNTYAAKTGPYPTRHYPSFSTSRRRTSHRRRRAPTRCAST